MYVQLSIQDTQSKSNIMQYQVHCPSHTNHRFIAIIQYQVHCPSYTSWSYTPSVLVKEVVLDIIWVKHWEYKSSITFKLLSLQMWKLYEFICLEKYFHKNIHISLFYKYFYNNKMSKLCFEDHVVILNDFFY